MMKVELGERVRKPGWGIGQSKREEIPKSTLGKSMISGLLGSLCSWEAVREAKKEPSVCISQSFCRCPTFPLTQFWSPGCSSPQNPLVSWNIP